MDSKPTCKKCGKTNNVEYSLDGPLGTGRYHFNCLSSILKQLKRQNATRALEYKSTVFNENIDKILEKGLIKIGTPKRILNYKDGYRYFKSIQFTLSTTIGDGENKHITFSTDNNGSILINTDLNLREDTKEKLLRHSLINWMKAYYEALISTSDQKDPGFYLHHPMYRSCKNKGIKINSIIGLS